VKLGIAAGTVSDTVHVLPTGTLLTVAGVLVEIDVEPMIPDPQL
jgi:hypothetical protein